MRHVQKKLAQLPNATQIWLSFPLPLRRLCLILLTLIVSSPVRNIHSVLKSLTTVSVAPSKLPMVELMALAELIYFKDDEFMIQDGAPAGPNSCCCCCCRYGTSNVAFARCTVKSAPPVRAERETDTGIDG